MLWSKTNSSLPGFPPYSQLFVVNALAESALTTPTSNWPITQQFSDTTRDKCSARMMCREQAARTPEPGLGEKNDVILFSQPWEREHISLFLRSLYQPLGVLRESGEAGRPRQAGPAIGNRSGNCWRVLHTWSKDTIWQCACGKEELISELIVTENRWRWCG